MHNINLELLSDDQLAEINGTEAISNNTVYAATLGLAGAALIAGVCVAAGPLTLAAGACYGFSCMFSIAANYCAIEGGRSGVKGQP